MCGSVWLSHVIIQLIQEVGKVPWLTILYSNRLPRVHLAGTRGSFPSLYLKEHDSRIYILFLCSLLFFKVYSLLETTTLPLDLPLC
jgi:hypothetical protein